MPGDKRKRRHYSNLAEASSIGLMFPIAIALGYGWGYGMDKMFGTRPWLTVIFTVFGVIAAFLNLFRAAMGADGTVDPAGGESAPGTDGVSGSGGDAGNGTGSDPGRTDDRG